MNYAPLVLGATGQIGTAFRLGASELLGGRPIWQARRAIPNHLYWDILNEGAPEVECSGIVLLAGTNRDTAEVHIALAKAACDLGERLAVPVVIASTQAVYGVQGQPNKETDTCRPVSAYGLAKAQMEDSVADRDNVTCLRVGNVPGADMLFGAVRRGSVVLDQWPDGRGPRRSMIGLRELARVIGELLKMRSRPKVLNIAQPGLISMQSLLEAAKVEWQWQPAPADAVPELQLDLSLLTSLVELTTGSASQMVDEARLCGAIA